MKNLTVNHVEETQASALNHGFSTMKQINQASTKFIAQLSVSDERRPWWQNLWSWLKNCSLISLKIFIFFVHVVTVTLTILLYRNARSVNANR